MAEADARRTWVTYGLIVANLFAFVMELVAGASPTRPAREVLIELGANFAPRTLHGEPWRLFSSMFLHAGLIHIGFNLVGLWQGRMVELIFGRAGFVSIYLVSGLLGGVACMAFSPEAVTVGASGAVFGVFGAFTAYLALRRAALPAEVWRSTTRQMVMFLGINVVIGLSLPGISLSAHLGGFAGGFAVGAALLVGSTANRQRVLRAVGLTLVGLVLTTVALLTLRAPDDLEPAYDEYYRVHVASLAKYQDLTTRAASGAIPEQQAADEIERDVLAPWKKLRAELAAIDHPSDRLAPLWEALQTYVASRQAVWEAAVAVLRAPADAQARLIADFQQKEQTATKDFETVQSRLAALQH